VTIKPRTEYSVLIGDVVKSRSAPSQESLLADLQLALDWLNEAREDLEMVQPVSLTVGDEFQGVFAHLNEALRAALLVQLHLKGRYDLRFGIGRGEVTTVAPERAPMAQSGEGWWLAREAIEEASDLASKKEWPKSVRTRVKGAGALEPAINAFLLCQDQIFSRMDRTDCAIALQLFERSSQRQEDLAKELGITQSSVSRRQAENGPSSIYRAHQELERLVQ